MYIYTIYNLFEKFNKLEKNKKIIIVLLLIIILLCIGTNILRHFINKTKNVWNYKEITSAEELLHKGEKISDRNIYWQLKDIIYNFISTRSDEVNSQLEDDKKVDCIEYYDVLSKAYRKFLSKEEFLERAVRFTDKFLLERQLVYKYVDDFVIEEIYVYDDNKYLCVLKANGEKEKGYIGIELNKKDQRFSIFYVE